MLTTSTGWAPECSTAIIDEPRMQRRRLRGDDHHDDVDVGGDGAPPLRHVRVGAREQAAAWQRAVSAVTVAPPFDEHFVAGGEVALLDVPARSAVRVAATSTPSRSTVQAPATMPVTTPRSAPASAAACNSASSAPSPSSGATSSSKELVELRPARAGLLRPERRPAQLGRSSGESEPLAVVELGEQRLESSALLLIHRWMSPSGEVRHDRARTGRDTQSPPCRRRALQRRPEPGASPAREEERRRPPRGRPGTAAFRRSRKLRAGPHEG